MRKLRPLGLRTSPDPEEALSPAADHSIGTGAFLFVSDWVSPTGDCAKAQWEKSEHARCVPSDRQSRGTTGATRAASSHRTALRAASVEFGDDHVVGAQLTLRHMKDRGELVGS